MIPHGTTWGFYTPPGTSMDKALDREQHDPERQRLIEIHSGHGNSEEYRSWREFEVADDGSKVCPAPTPDYLPCCWQAGEIMRERCGDLDPAECDARVEEAKRLALDAGVSAHLLFPDTRAEDWLDCGQCRDCFKPTLALRPRESVQYTMAISNFDEPEPDGSPLRFRYGFIASSDNHKARPGTGYKQYERRRMTEATGPRSEFYDELDPPQPAHAAARGSRSAAGLRADAGAGGPAHARHRAGRELPLPGRPGGGALRGAHARADLGRARAARGLRDQRPAHAALVRPAERAGGARADGRRREPRLGAALRGARGRRARAEARLRGVRRGGARRRAARISLPRRVLQPERRAPPDRRDRGGADPPAADARAKRWIR